MINIVKSIFKFSNLKIAGLLALVLFVVLIIAPRKDSVSLADNTNCTNSQTPVFNPYPISNTAGGCNDYAFMRAQVLHNGAKSGFKTGSVQAQAGDQVEIVLYIDNGAALDAPAMTGMQLNTTAGLAAGSSHGVSASVSAANASNSLSGSVNVLTNDGSRLQVNSDTGQWFEGTSYAGEFGNIVNKNTSLPDQRACFPYVRFIYIVLDVVAAPTQPATLFCVVKPATSVPVGTTVNFAVGGGDGNYSWTVDGGSVRSSSLQNFDSIFNTAGNFTARVSSGDGQNANCSLTVNSAACVVNTAAVLTASALTRNGSTYSTTLTWSSSGSNQIRIAQIISGGSETVLTVGSAGGSVNVTGLAAGTTYVFRMYDASSCGRLLTLVQVVTPGNPGQLICTNAPTANIDEEVIFTASNGTAPFTWKTSTDTFLNRPASFAVRFQGSGSKLVTVTSSDGRVADCNIFISPPASIPAGNGSCNNSSNSCNNNNNTNNQGGNSGNNSSNQSNQNNINGNNNTVTNTNNNCVNNSCNNVNTYSYNYQQPNYSQTSYYSQAAYQPNVLGGNVGLTYSKRAVNETKNADATTVNASREDFITYTLTVANNGNTPANNFIITDDLSQVLPYADMVDNGGGSLGGNTINYPGITVPAGGSVSRSFKVRVKFSLAPNLSYSMSNTYGNTVAIRINAPQVLGAFVAPKTGVETMGFTFAGMFTAAFVALKKRKGLMKLIFT